MQIVAVAQFHTVHTNHYTEKLVVKQTCNKRDNFITNVLRWIFALVMFEVHLCLPTKIFTPQCEHLAAAAAAVDSFTNI